MDRVHDATFHVRRVLEGVDLRIWAVALNATEIVRQVEWIIVCIASGFARYRKLGELRLDRGWRTDSAYCMSENCCSRYFVIMRCNLLT